MFIYAFYAVLLMRTSAAAAYTLRQLPTNVTALTAAPAARKRAPSLLLLRVNLQAALPRCCCCCC
jgi:hypothetical protein